MTNKEAMQMALDALNNFDKGNHGMRWQVPVIEALRTALAQPEPKPYGYLWFTRHMEQRFTHRKPKPHGYLWFTRHTEQRFTHRKPKEDERIGDVKPLYTAPPQREWQGLTDKEYEAMAEDHVTDCYFDTLTYAKAIEAKLKEKNT